MEEIKDNSKPIIVSFFGYKIGCFLDTKDKVKVLEIVSNLKLDLGLIITKRSKSSGYSLNFITEKEGVNAIQLVNALLEEGSHSGVFTEYKGHNNTHSATVYATNSNFINR